MKSVVRIDSSCDVAYKRGQTGPGIGPDCRFAGGALDETFMLTGRFSPRIGDADMMTAARKQCKRHGETLRVGDLGSRGGKPEREEKEGATKSGSHSWTSDPHLACIARN